MATNLSVAQTILFQLGGMRFVRMTGAKNLVGSDRGLSMRVNSFNSDHKRVNVVHIALDPSDTYTVVASYMRAGKIKNVATVSDVYCDQLQAVFTRVTGLQTTLGIPAAEMRKFFNRHED